MNEPDAQPPERDTPGQEPRADGHPQGDPAAIIARIQTAGDAVPATLRDAVYGIDKKDPPSLLIESAEGVTTFGGFNGHPGTPAARRWLEARLAAIAKRYSAPPAASPETARTDLSEPSSTSTDT